jgi:hypothetical protein
MTTENFCFYLQNRLIQASQTGGQWYSDTLPPLVFPGCTKTARFLVFSVVRNADVSAFRSRRRFVFDVFSNLPFVSAEALQDPNECYQFTLSIGGEKLRVSGTNINLVRVSLIREH